MMVNLNREVSFFRRVVNDMTEIKNREAFEGAVKLAKASNSIEEKRRRVLAKYSPIFQPANISTLDLDKFRRFFNYTENEHWDGIVRNVGRLVADPAALKQALAELMDESRPIQERIDKVTGRSGPGMIKGFGPATISAVLQVAYPDRYGVYNRVSMEGLSKIGLNPADSTPNWDSISLGKRYAMINEVLVDLSKTYGVTLWALDWVWWELLYPGDEEDLLGTSGSVSQLQPPTPSAPPTAIPMQDGGAFTLESHLEDFLVENWENTPLCTNLSLEILTDEKTGEAIGKQYRTDAGHHRIDLLCKNKETNGYTVVELKRDKTSDEVVGQVQRYMGWVKKNLSKNQPVDGIVICHEADENLKYALSVTPNIRFFLYQVSFKLDPGEVEA